jgi:hypothetical protein
VLAAVRGAIDDRNVHSTRGYPAVSAQRARERRIVEKPRAGILRSATPLDTPRSRVIGESPCDGCDEVEADCLVGDKPWHSLWVLFWQGRSEGVSASPSREVPPERKGLDRRCRTSGWRTGATDSPFRRIAPGT